MGSSPSTEEVLQKRMLAMSDDQIVSLCNAGKDTTLMTICNDPNFWVKKLQQTYPTFPRTMVSKDGSASTFRNIYFGLKTNDLDLVYANIYPNSYTHDITNKDIKKWAIQELRQRNYNNYDLFGNTTQIPLTTNDMLNNYNAWTQKFNDIKLR